MILEHPGIEVGGLRRNDMRRELHHLNRKLHLRNSAEILFLSPHLVRKTQRHPAKAVAHWRNQHRALARGQYYAGKAGDVFAAHGVADHRERLLADRVARQDIIWLIGIPHVDLPRGNETLDLDGAGILPALGEESLFLLIVLAVFFTALFLFGVVFSFLPLFRGDRRRGGARWFGKLDRATVANYA